MAKVEWREFAHSGYEVSSAGEVRRIGKDKCLAPRYHRNGYVRVMLGVGVEEFIHRVVLLTFVGEPPAGHESDHINNIRDDNRLENLQWLSRAKNLAKRTLPKGGDHYYAKLTEEKVRIIKAGPMYPGRDGELASLYGVSRETVRDARLGKVWGHVT